MIIGVPKEIKNQEYRVGLVPSSVQELTSRGHQVIVEEAAGNGIRVMDQDYRDVGAEIVDTAAEVYARADMIVKVKEPQTQEYGLLREGQILFTYLHLAAEPKLTDALIESGAIAIAYETVTDRFGGLPLLSPMSEVAGRMSIQAGAHCLEKAHGGSGILLGGVPGVRSANVVVIGGGVVGTNAIRMAMGMEAHVTVIDKSLNRLRELDLQFGSKLNTIFSTKFSIEQYTSTADLVVGAVLIPGAAAPKLVTAEMVKQMSKGSVIVDVAIDQGGSFETSRPTTHDDPIYIQDDVVHYCVTNMPGAVPRTSTFALNNATLLNVIALAELGYEKALEADRHLLDGLNVYRSQVTNLPVAEALGKPYVDPKTALMEVNS